MKCIIAIDDNSGMMFGKRRQSQDKVLCDYIINLCKNDKLYMNSYSKKLFDDSDNIIVDEDFINKANDNFCFVESIKPSEFIDKIHTIYLCKWNRAYPSTLKFDIDLKDWNLESTIDIVGKSHEKITIEKWSK